MIISLIIALLHSLTLGVKESQRGIDGNKEGGDDVREREREKGQSTVGKVEVHYSAHYLNVGTICILKM